MALERKQKQRVDVELKLDGYEHCAKSQHTHSYILPLHKKLPHSTSILILSALLLGRLRVQSQPTVLFFASLCVSFPFLTWHLAQQPASHRDKRYDLTSLQCSTDREREPESQQERERKRGGNKRNNTEEECWGGTTKKTEGWSGSTGGGRKFRKTRFILLSLVPLNFYAHCSRDYRHIVLVADASNTKIKTFVLPRVGKTLKNEALVNSKTLAIANTQKYMEKNDGQ